MEPAGELAQLREAGAQLGLGEVEQLGRLGVVAEPHLDLRQQQVDADEPRLGAVVEVALQAPAFGVARVDEPHA